MYVWRLDPIRARGGYQTSKRYGPEATIGEMKAWRTEQALRGKQPDLFVEPDTAATTFSEDATLDYLTRATVITMPTFAQRKQHITEWVVTLGRLPAARSPQH